MEVRAIILLGPATEPNAPESIGGVPMALLDVLGRPLLNRVIDRLARYGVSETTVIGDTGADGLRFLSRAMRSAFIWSPAEPSAMWNAAQRAFFEYAQDGADLVLVLRLGPYAEIDYDHLMQGHLDRDSRVTAVTDARGELLGTFVVSASRRNDAAFLLRHHLQEFRTPVLKYPFTGYLNRLANPADLRRLAVDAFGGRAQIEPHGVEIRPGVWAAPDSRIHPAARVLAPAFIGEHAKVRASAVITRCSVLEHHVVVDCGTVVEDATVLPYTRLGIGLDVVHSVLGFRKVFHLRRQVEVEITDPKLLDIASSAPTRVLGHAAALAGFLPLNFVRGLFGRRESRAPLPAAAQAPAAALKATESLPATDPVITNFR